MKADSLANLVRMAEKLAVGSAKEYPSFTGSSSDT